MPIRQFDVRKELAEFSRYVLNSKQICYLVFDADQYLVAANQAAKELYADVFSNDILEGEHISNFKPKGLARFGAEMMAKCNAKMPSESVEKYLQKSTQSIIFILCRFTPVFDNQDKLKYYLGTFADITTSRKIEKNLLNTEANLLAVLDSSNDQFILCDTNLNVVMFNSLAAKYILKTSKLTIEKGKPVLDYVSEPDRVSFARHIKLASSGKTLTAERKLVSPRGNEAWIEITSSPIKNLKNEITNVLITYRNISERKKHEMALRDSESNLSIIFNSGTQGFVLADKDGRCLIHNPDAERFFAKYCGISLERGVLLADKEHQGFAKHLARDIRMSQNGGRIYTEEEFQDGKTTRHFSVQFDPVKADPEKRVTIWIVDITGRKKAENLLRQSESNLQAIFNNTNQTFYLINKNLGIDHINKAAEEETFKQYGRSAKKGDSILEYINAPNLFAAQSNIDKAFAGKQSTEENFVNSAGQIKWFERHYNPIFASNGKVEQITIWSIDVSERKKIETALISSEWKFKQLSLLSPVGIYQTDENNQIVFTNNSLQKILGIKSNEIMERKWMWLIHADDIERVKKKVQTAHSNRAEYFTEYRLQQKKTGHIINVYEQAVPLFEDSLHFTGYLGTVVDITEHIERQKFKTEKEHAEKSLKYKSDFLAGMSHEIRTPLTTILGYAELMGDTVLNTDQKDSLKVIFNAAQNLRSIVNDILDLSKLEAGKADLKKEVFMAGDLVSETVKAFSLLAKERGIELNGFGEELAGICLKSDKRRLLQVLGNFTKNAILYTPEGKVDISIYIERDYDNSALLKVEVKDTGIGIKSEDLPKLFSEYSQLETVKTSFDGTGLGLILSKKIVELFDGEIGVESEFGKGSKFWFTFIAEKASPKLIQKETKTTKLPQCNILLAEDIAINRMAFDRMLKKLGMTVVQAQNGNEVLEKYATNSFDLIFMDLQMPGLDGISTIKVLNEKYKKLPPIIGLSGNITQNLNNNYLNYGMSDFLSKPIVSSDFERIIGKWGRGNKN